MSEAKFIQLETVQTRFGTEMYALDSDGAVWQRYHDAVGKPVWIREKSSQRDDD